MPLSPHTYHPFSGSTRLLLIGGTFIQGHTLPSPHPIALGSFKDPQAFQWVTSRVSKGLSTHILSSWYFELPTPSF